MAGKHPHIMGYNAFSAKKQSTDSGIGTGVATGPSSPSVTSTNVLSNSTKLCYTYDSLNRVTQKTVKKLADGSVVSSETFCYDAAGNITGAPDSCFQYDTNNRLTVWYI